MMVTTSVFAASRRAMTAGCAPGAQVIDMVAGDQRAQDAGLRVGDQDVGLDVRQAERLVAVIAADDLDAGDIHGADVGGHGLNQPATPSSGHIRRDLVGHDDSALAVPFPGLFHAQSIRVFHGQVLLCGLFVDDPCFLFPYQQSSVNCFLFVFSWILAQIRTRVSDNSLCSYDTGGEAAKSIRRSSRFAG